VIRVLVAEDHAIVREGIKQLIGMARDLEVVGEASNGEQLMETLRKVECDVVLLDISMPGVNGLEAIPRIRALLRPPAILVLSMVFEVGLTDSRPPHAQLSEREFSVFERLVRGEGVNDIALHLAVSNKTVSTHKARLMQKLGLQSVADLVRYAMEHKLL